MENQVFFEGCKLKQKFTKLWNDGYLKEMSSARLENFQNSIHHCWSFEKQSSIMDFQLGFYGCKGLTKMARAWNNERVLEFFEALARNSKSCQFQNERMKVFSVLGGCGLLSRVGNEQKIRLNTSV
jgi:hypothetical protein